MKRRRLLYGLGLATVGSSATALTGATLSNTVSPAADFRVKVDAGLLVEAGGWFTKTDIFGETNIKQGKTKAGRTKNNFYLDTDDNYVYFTHDDTFSFEGTDSEFRAGIQSERQEAFETNGGNYPEFIVNDINAINGDLKFAATIPFIKGKYAVYFRDAIKVTNQTGGRADIEIRFEDGGNSGYGDDVGSNGVLTKDQVKELIQIKGSLFPTYEEPLGDKLGQGAKLSPAAPEEDTQSVPYTLDQGETLHLHVGFDIPFGTFDDTGLGDALEAYTTDPANDETTLDFLDTLFIGVVPP
jgi:hypothetical protein